MKNGYFGLMEASYLAGSASVISLLSENFDIPLPAAYIPLDKMIYVSAFQGGIQKFVTNITFEGNSPVDRFISSKVVVPPDPNHDLLKKLSEIFPKSESTDSATCQPMIMSFIHDLIVGMDSDASIINVSGIPKIEDIKSCLPIDVAAPICNLISQFEPTDELLPAPSLIISADHVDRYKELLDSDLFSKYSSAHKELEVVDLEDGKVLENVKDKGRELIVKSKGALENRRVSVNVLSNAPKIVEAAFGKLPGVIAQTAADLGLNLLNSERNIVVYQFNDWLNEYAKDYTVKMIESMRFRSQDT